MKIKLKNGLLQSTMIATAMATGTLALTVVPMNAYAQDYTSGAIEGTVFNTAGEPMAGATVTAVSEARGTRATSVTGPDGNYRLPRLQIGTYDIQVTADGFNTLTGQTASVSVGQTLNKSFVVTGGGVDEIITTAVKQNSFDFEVASTGLVLDVQETFDRTPIPRNLQSLTLLTPGTVAGDTAFGSLASLGGASVAENSYYINGMAITNFRNFTGSSTVPFEFYQQVETKTGGYPAEFGRATGGVSNAVTKSGTNEFHFGGNAFWAPNFARETSPNTLFSVNDLDEAESIDANLYASGPIIKDKLFFYGLFSPQKTTNQGTSRTYSFDTLALQDTGSRFENTADTPFYGAKIDFNLSDNHQFEGTFFRDRSTLETRNFNINFVNGTEDEIATLLTESGGNVFIGKYTGKLTDWLTVSGLYGNQTFDQTISQTGGDCFIISDQRSVGFDTLASEADRVQDCSASGAPLQSDDQDQRELFRGDADVFVDNFFGDHHFRVGIDVEKLTSSTNQTYTGGAAYTYFSSSSAVYQGAGDISRQRVRTLTGDYQVNEVAYYIQDSWDVTDRLTLNLGLRNDSFDNKNVNGDTFLKLENQWAPRVGGAYDVFGDGFTTAFASWGRYFLGVASNTNMRLAGNEADQYSYYELLSANGSGAPTIGSTLLRQITFSDGIVKDPSALIDENIQPMYADELIIGARHDFNNGWNVGASFTHRALKSTIDDVAIDAAVNQYCADNGISGCSSVWSGFHQYVLTNPGADMRINLNTDPGAAAVLGVADGEAFMVDLTAADLNYPVPSRKYDAIEFTFDRDFKDGWDLHGSYTFSNLEGNYEGSVISSIGQDDAGLTQDFDQPGLLDGAYGKSPNHRTHKIKTWGAFDLTDDLLVGARYTLESPRQFSCLGVHPTDAFAQAYGAFSYYCNGKLVQRGTAFEGDWIGRLDLNFVYDASHLMKSVPGTLKLRADVFNVFNTEGASDWREIGETSSGAQDMRYGTPTGYQTPRYFRFGISYDY
jgi:outer membrane receptor protein involved in Fe transport